MAVSLTGLLAAIEAISALVAQLAPMVAAWQGARGDDTALQTAIDEQTAQLLAVRARLEALVTEPAPLAESQL